MLFSCEASEEPISSEGDNLRINFLCKPRPSDSAYKQALGTMQKAQHGTTLSVLSTRQRDRLRTQENAVRTSALKIKFSLTQH